METPLTDKRGYRLPNMGYLFPDMEVVSAEFTRGLEKDLRWLLLGTFALYEDDPLRFAPETCKVFEKYKYAIDEMLEGGAA